MQRISQDARYWIPTENEWYKAAYYDPSPQGPADHYWLYPWRSDQVDGRPANFYNGTYTVTGRSKIDASYTYLTDVRDFSENTQLLWHLKSGRKRRGMDRGRCVFWRASFPRRALDSTEGSAIIAYHRIASYSPPVLVTDPTDPRYVGFRVATVANPPAGGLKNGDKIRFYPRAGHGDRMVGGVFEGGTDRSVLYGSSYDNRGSTGRVDGSQRQLR